MAGNNNFDVNNKENTVNKNKEGNDNRELNNNDNDNDVEIVIKGASKLQGHYASSMLWLASGTSFTAAIIFACIGVIAGFLFLTTLLIEVFSILYAVFTFAGNSSSENDDRLDQISREMVASLISLAVTIISISFSKGGMWVSNKLYNKIKSEDEEHVKLLESDNSDNTKKQNCLPCLSIFKSSEKVNNGDINNNVEGESIVNNYKNSFGSIN